MIDYIKLEIIGGNKEKWLNNSKLNFYGKYSHKTSEAKENLEADYKCLKFKIFESGRMIIQGSIHKFYNALNNIYAPNQRTEQDRAKGFNGNDFNYSKLLYTVKLLKRDFNFDTAIVRGVETGLNIKHLFITDLILNGFLLYKGKIFKTPLNNSYRESELFHYKIKCYDKALQYGLSDEVFRYELKYRKMEYFNKCNIVYLDDLLIKDNLSKVLLNLINKWDKITFYDYTIDENILTDKQLLFVKDFSNTTYWKSLPSNRLDRPRKRYKKLEEKHSKNIKSEIRKLIISEWNNLLNDCVSIDLNAIKNVRIDHSNIGSNITHLNKQLLPISNVS